MSAVIERETPQQAARRFSAGAIRDGFQPQALHCYTDESGDALFWRMRANNPATGEKWIRPMHLEGGEFVMGEPAFDEGKPIYRLHEIAGHPDAPVFVVEGEGCADALVKASLIATTSGGAGSAAAADWSPLAGRAITIWPDNDEPGQQYAVDVAERLRALGCTVRVIDVAALDLDPKGDAVDWLAVNPGATADDVLALPCLPCLPHQTAEPQTPRHVSRCMADIKSVPVRWLWPGRIARGKLTIVAGMPGLGKSQITASMASVVTSGGLWPVDRSRAGSGSVIFLTAEDDAADTLRPRLEAAGAVLTRVYVLDAVRAADREGRPFERGFDLTRDLDALADLIDTIGDVRLVVIDPITAYLGATDSHRNAEVRAVLAPLAALAAKYDVAVVAVSHLNKSGGADALSRVTGSLAFVAAARAAFIVAKDPADPDRRLFLPVKNNIGPDGDGLAYRIEAATVGDIHTSQVAWGSERVTMTAGAALAAIESRGSERGEDDAPQRGEAEAWLRDALAAGAVASKELKHLARADSVAWRTIERAKKALGVMARKHGFGDEARWSWELPADEDRHTDKDRHRTPPTPDDVAAFAESEATSPFVERVSAKAATAQGLGGLRGDDGGLRGCTADEYAKARGAF
ncbi:AAA family ATPase [Immundisolibacter cernigliae]|uniref:AAA+ ATPase domain-containing protein n=1 Tax=Immundisolibacter cernigliae TaxID=1810504 RepID=A0A1B1YRK1_9GAMM|nr:AAA family ATPase [Immundisolibacter cernigliae]ANX03405.1 hypothetical protein PG2T_03815 [Immundisolibacter cernigliae]